MLADMQKEGSRNTRYFIRLFLRIIQHMEGKATKQNTPSTWRKDQLPFIFDTLDDIDHFTPRIGNSSTLDSYMKLMEPAFKLIDKFKGPEFLARFNRQHIVDIASNLSNNTITVIDSIQSTDIGRAVYPSSNYFKHSCLPNCTHYLDSNGMSVYRTTQAIKAGEDITTTMLDIMLSRSKRIDSLLEENGFYCQCPRCVANNQDYQCPTCEQALDSNHLRIWEPIPSADFDGRVYQ
ncbi:hypothetical protein SAMD00019534_114410 [Acytostelium subglobosum LB1]|uniref:hypothetical protein n=1 Tax=Acytostelium subglobosum LB1 TaxID=1410327 RepID=UPI000644C64C|nr:hypothetical protein SAMD00019534_114410 [Acytostelium subglobosum LB1]GAM28265.1 hypothetical protein SAMD00019534_114410 [Acytostelium subglobosum LB1]|eukprot:XP_012748899.1 hypothetical protein SAMD00019534_114410 [Acytostelium subglobosum LB1]